MKNTDFKNILPPGTVVKLNIMKEEHANEKFLIIKRFVVEKLEDKDYYEYEAMLLPTGTKDGNNIMFNSEQIKEVVHEGYTDEKEEKFTQGMEKIIKQTNAKRKEVS